MGILAWVILGGLAGWIASMIAKTNESMGVLANVVVGIVGALIGGFLFGLFGGEGVSGFNFYGIIVAVVGALVLLWFLKLIRK